MCHDKPDNEFDGLNLLPRHCVESLGLEHNTNLIFYECLLAFKITEWKLSHEVLRSKVTRTGGSWSAWYPLVMLLLYKVHPFLPSGLCLISFVTVKWNFMWCFNTLICIRNNWTTHNNTSIRHSLPANFPSQLQMHLGSHRGNQHKFTHSSWHDITAHFKPNLFSVLSPGNLNWPGGDGNFETKFQSQTVAESKNSFGTFIYVLQRHQTHGLLNYLKQQYLKRSIGQNFD